jgi:broad specificity phosphatase PhoE
VTLAAPLYMLRHGETAWNTERRMQGTKDSALTERGRAQAQAMGLTLKAELERAPGPTLFLRSPLGRVRETSEIIGRALGLEPGQWRDDPRLAELSYGQWEGFSWKEIEVTHPTALADWRADPHGYCPPGGEPHIELRRRSAEVLAEIISVSMPGRCSCWTSRRTPSSACWRASRKRSFVISATVAPSAGSHCFR